MGKKLFVGLLGIMLLLAGVAALSAQEFVKAGNKLGDLEFPPPSSAEAAKYLGVPEGKPFKLSQLNAPYVLVEVFATSCPHCVTHAPIMNQFFNLVKNDGKIKVIGLGSGDSANNLLAWQKQFKVPFPLLADTDHKTTNKINIMGTPTTVFMNKNGDVLDARPGAFMDAQDFLKDLKKLMK